MTQISPEHEDLHAIAGSIHLARHENQHGELSSFHGLVKNMGGKVHQSGNYFTLPAKHHTGEHKTVFDDYMADHGFDRDNHYTLHDITPVEHHLIKSGYRPQTDSADGWGSIKSWRRGRESTLTTDSMADPHTSAFRAPGEDTANTSGTTQSSKEGNWSHYHDTGHAHGTGVATLKTHLENLEYGPRDRELNDRTRAELLAHLQSTTTQHSEQPQPQCGGVLSVPCPVISG